MSLPQKDRLEAMIWGQFAGDAATLGTHWIYNPEDLERAHPHGIRGFESPAPGHYHQAKRSGEQTHYGDVALLLLESVAAHKAFNLEDFAARFVGFFNDPHCTAYKDHATRETLAHLEAKPGDLQNGAPDDDQPATVTRLAALFAVGGADRIEELTRFCQNNDRAVAYAQAHGQILATLLDGRCLNTALDSVTEVEPRAMIAAARASLGQHSVLEATLAFGQSCPLASSFPAALHAMLSFPEDFPTAILETTRAGGDNAARASMIGAWMGALHGKAGVPAAWLEKLHAGPRISRALERLAS